jgi:hypothetical protein
MQACGKIQVCEQAAEELGGEIRGPELEELNLTFLNALYCVTPKLQPTTETS